MSGPPTPVGGRARGRVRSFAIGLALALALGAGLWIAAGDGGEHAPEPQAASPIGSGPEVSLGPPSTSHAASAGVSTDETARILALARGPLPRSLRGTEVDGALATDADGHFVPTPDALALFDYFLSASGEEAAAVIEQRIRDAVHARLEPAAAAEALALLADYLSFREEARALASSDAIPADLDRRLQWVRELRRRHFGAEVADALFGESERVTLIDLERRRVAADPDLDPEARANALASLDEALPERVREVRSRTRAPSRVREEVNALREAGADSGEIFAARERAFGTEAAERLARLDESRAVWQSRLDRYRSERAALLEDSALHDPGEQALTVDALRARHFPDATERERVRLLDRFDASSHDPSRESSG